MGRITVAVNQLEDRQSFEEFMGRLGETGVVFRPADEEVRGVFVLRGRQVETLTNAEELGNFLLYSWAVEIVNGEGNPLPFQRAARVLGTAVICGRGGLPALRGLMRSPCYRISEGRLVERPVGYDAVSGVLVLAAEFPSFGDVDPSYPHLKALFSGITYADEVYHGNLMGILAASVARTAIDEFPVILIDAAQKSSGKTQVASAIRLLVNAGMDLGPIVYSGNEQEFEVRMGSYAGKPGPNVIHIDNVRAKQGGINRIRSQALSASVHGHTVRVRRLHVGPVPLHDPVVIFTMNGARVEGDLADKSVGVSLIRPPGSDVHRAILPHPTSYVHKNQMAILAEIHDIIKKVEIKPIGEVHSDTRFYIFEQIVRSAAGLLGMKASFDPSIVRTSDITVDELLNLLHDEALLVDGKVGIQKLSDVLQANPGVKELNEMVSATSRSNKGRPAALRDYLLNNLAGHTYRWSGQVVKIDLDGSDLVVVRS